MPVDCPPGISRRGRPPAPVVVAGGLRGQSGRLSAPALARRCGWWRRSTLSGTGVAALYAGGDFASPGTHVASWNGSAWSALGGGVDGTVRALASYRPNGQAAALCVGGDFQNAGGSLAPGVARWDGTSWSAVGGGVAGLAGVYALAVFDDGGGAGPALYAGGASSGGGGGGAIFRWSGGAWTAVGGSFDGLVAVLAVFDDGGRRRSSGALRGRVVHLLRRHGAAAPGLAHWSGTSWSPVTGGGTGSGGVRARRSSPPGSVAALAVWGRRRRGPALWIGGDFYLASLAAGRRDAYALPGGSGRGRSPAPTARRRGSPSPRPPKAPHARRARRFPSSTSPTARPATTPIPAPCAMTANGAAAVTSCVAGSGGASTLACTPARRRCPAGAVRLSATIANLSGVVSAPAILDVVVPALTLSFTAPAEGATLTSR